MLTNSFKEYTELQVRLEAMTRAEHEVSNAYLRLRQMIPGALDTPWAAPTSRDIWLVTEAALRRLLDRLAIRVEAESHDR